MNDVLPAAGDLLTFVEVADAGGFAAASRRTGIPKSRLSRRVAALEAFLGVALLRRDARRFLLTELGERIYAHGQAARLETQAAVSIARDSVDTPRGHLRVACPLTLAAIFLADIARKFSTCYPDVLLKVQTTNGSQGPLDDGADILIQPATHPLSDSSLIGRELAVVSYGLYASPSLAASLGTFSSLVESGSCPAVGWSFTPQSNRWTLQGPDGGSAELKLDLRFVSDSLLLNCDAALSGIGVAQLPVLMAGPRVKEGRLVRFAPAWHPPNIHIHALYPSRRHLTPAGRCFLDMLTQDLSVVEMEG